MAPLLKAEGITKRFPGVTALDDVSITLNPGEIHCIVGENGAGKSTLVKILTGLYKPDEGTLTIMGETGGGNASSVIAYVPQEINLFDHLSVAENILMPFEHLGSKWFFFNRSRVVAEARKLMDRLHMEADPQALVSEISVAERQLLQIARALANRDFRILILDEPTASLTNREVERLFRVINDLRDQGKCIVFITHRLEEVLELHDQVTVLRNGQVVGHSADRDIDVNWIVRQMTGKALDLNTLYRPVLPQGEEVLAVESLSGPGFENVSFCVREGEVLGVAGLVGAGRSEVMQTLFGLLSKTSGSATFRGRPWPFGTPKRSIRDGLIYLPEERKSHGIFANLSVRENVSIGVLRDVAAQGVIRAGAEKEVAARVISEYRVKTASDRTPIVFLSGGNQQKILLGRALEARPRLLILDEPTRGIDVNAKAEIFALMKKFAEEERMAIIFVSSDLEELLRCCNRILIMYDGRVSAEFAEDSIRREDVLNAILGTNVQRRSRMEGASAGAAN